MPISKGCILYEYLQNEVIEMEDSVTALTLTGGRGQWNREEAKKGMGRDLCGDGISLYLNCVTVGIVAIILYLEL